MKRLLLFVALFACFGAMAQVQPTILNGDMQDMDNTYKTDQRQYAGWVNTDLGKAPGESSNYDGSLKIDDNNPDYLYQEVDVEPNNDYVLSYDYQMKTQMQAEYGVASVQALVLNEVDGYTPGFEPVATRPYEDMGYTSYTELAVPANIVAESKIEDTGDDSRVTVDVPFNSGDNEYIALVFRGLGILDVNGIDSANGGSETRFTTIRLVNVTAANTSTQLTDLQWDNEGTPETVDGFTSAQLEYDVELPKYTTDVPSVTYTEDDDALSTVLTEATELPGTTTVLVNGTDDESQTYSINFTVEPLSDDATLSDLTVDGTTVDGFDSETYDYVVELGVGEHVTPAVTATKSSVFTEFPDVAPEITDADEVPGTTTILVTAEDGSIATYTIEFTNYDPSAAVQPLIVNGDMQYLLNDDGGTKRYTGWENESLGDPTQESSDFDGSLKFPNSGDRVAYQEVEVLENTDYTLTFKYSMETTGSTGNLGSFQTLVLKGSNYDASYTPSYGSATDRLCDDLGYRVNSDLDEPTNAITSSLIEDPGVEETREGSLTFNSGTETSIAIAFRGAGDLDGIIVISGDVKTWLWDVQLENVTPVVMNDDILLTDLQVDGTQVDGFDPQVLAYDVVLARDADEAVVTATANAAATSYAITDATAIPGIARVLVTGDADAKAEYSISFTQFRDGDATLSEIVIDGEAFDGLEADVFEYDVDYQYSATEVPTVTATASSLYATSVTVNATEELPGTTEIIVIADDGTEQTYLINFERGDPEEDATLSDLTVDGTTVDGFSDDVYEYDVVLAYETTIVPDVLATTMDENASYQLSETTELPGTSEVIVTAEDGDTELIYSVNFTVAAGTTDATLSNLTIDGTTVAGFDRYDFEYDVVLPSTAVDYPTIVGTPLYDMAGVENANDATFPGATTVTVTSEDESADETYTINFTVAATNDVTLSNLTLDGETIEDFENDKIAYAIVLDYGTTVSEIPEAIAYPSNAPEATASTLDATTLPGTSVITVIAADGTEQEIEIAFTVALNDDATLQDLTVGGETVEDFDADTYDYPVELDYGITDAPEVLATTTFDDAEAVVTDAASVPGTTTVLVTAADGTELTYSVIFTVALNDDATLQDLTVGGETVEDFDADTYDYPVELDYGTTVAPEVLATTTFDDAEAVVTDADPVPGTTTVLVTAADGTELTYSVIFTVALNDDATLQDLTVGDETVEDFDADTYEYTVELDYGTTDAPEVLATTTFDDAEAVVTDADSVPGTTTVLVTAADGTELTYSVIFTVAAPELNDVATLDSLFVNGDTVTGFNANTMSYTVMLAAGTTDVPVVTAVATDTNAKVTITDAASLTDTAMIVVLAEDGETQLTYKVSYTVDTENGVNNIVNSNVQVYSHSGVLNAKCSDAELNSAIKVYSLSGQLVLSEKLSSTHDKFVIDTKGLMIVRVIDANNNVLNTTKVVIE